MYNFEDKVAIVTGAGSVAEGWGNGKATAALLASYGAKILALDINIEAANATKHEIEKAGGQAIAYACDVTNSDEIQKSIEFCIENWGRLDILVNNVGGSAPGGAESMSEEQWYKQIDYNLNSVFLCCKYALPHLKKQQRSAIVNISSVAAIRMMHSRTHSAYSASKHGVIALSRSIAIENAKAGVRCNTVIPGLMLTPTVVHRLAKQLNVSDVDDLVAKRHAMVPMGQAGDAWDIAHAVAFLASDNAKHITATELLVDGGLTAVIP